MCLRWFFLRFVECLHRVILLVVPKSFICFLYCAKDAQWCFVYSKLANNTDVTVFDSLKICQMRKNKRCVIDSLDHLRHV